MSVQIHTWVQGQSGRIYRAIATGEYWNGSPMLAFKTNELKRMILNGDGDDANGEGLVLIAGKIYDVSNGEHELVPLLPQGYTYLVPQGRAWEEVEHTLKPMPRANLAWQVIDWSNNGGPQQHEVECELKQEGDEIVLGQHRLSIRQAEALLEDLTHASRLHFGQESHGVAVDSQITISLDEQHEGSAVPVREIASWLACSLGYELYSGSLDEWEPEF
jgi:hypothetical protein